jgi:L-2,4-diaminobutyrate decarboxylase
VSLSLSLSLSPHLHASRLQAPDLHDPDLHDPPDLQHLFHPAHADRYLAALHEGATHLAGHLARREGSPASGLAPHEAAGRVREVDLDQPLGDTGAALAELDDLWLDDTIWFHEPAYAAHLNCPVLVPALVAEVLASAVNSSLDTFDQSVGATFVERHLVDWTADRLGLGPGADGIFTSGGTQSNLQGLLLARDRATGRGTPPARQRILASREAHFSVQKAARLLGLGDDAVVTVATDAERRLDPVALGRALEGCRREDLTPVAVVATAGTTDFGAIDPLPEVAGLARAHDAWLHVDAAYGGGLLASRRHRHLLDGIEQADSVTVDFHKTWFLPVAASALLVRDAATLRHVTWHADYLNPRDTDHPNQVDKSLQTTRRFDALKLWLALRVTGADTIGEYVDRVMSLARAAHDHALTRPDLEVAAPPALSTLVLRHRPPGHDEDALADLNTRIRARLYASGCAMVAATKVDGRTFLKLTLLNPAATAADITRVVDLVHDAGATLVAEGAASDDTAADRAARQRVAS